MKGHSIRSTGGGLTLALEMIALFESVGTHSFDLTITNLDGDKQGFRRHLSPDTLRKSLPELLEQSEQESLNLILRPTASIQLIQLDDLNNEALALLTPSGVTSPGGVPLAFLTLCTSPGNHQAWLALPNPLPIPLVRELKHRTHADLSASGATRLAGSRNFKRARAPDFPLVTLKTTSPGLTTSEEELRSYGLLNAKSPHQPENHPSARTPVAGTPQSHRRHYRHPKYWPDYQRCLDHAPPAHGDPDRRDISRADFTWCLIALDQGHPADQLAARLMTLSPKAKLEGTAYAERTARRAAEAWAARQR